MTKVKTPPNVLTINQVADRWAFRPASIRRAIREGRIASARYLGHIVVPLVELEQIEAAGLYPSDDRAALSPINLVKQQTKEK